MNVALYDKQNDARLTPDWFMNDVIHEPIYIILLRPTLRFENL